MLDRIACIKSFVRTVEMGSFSAVAREQNTTQPTISKQIAALEEYLDVQLLVRSTRKVSLSDEGARFYEQCQQVLEALAAAESSVGRRQQPCGVLRVNCSVAFGQMQIMPRLKRFLDRYPEIEVDLTMCDRMVDMVEENIDLAIRIGNFVDLHLMSKQIGITRLIAVGSAAYFEKFAEPHVPSDLIHHNCIVYTRQFTATSGGFEIRQSQSEAISKSMTRRHCGRQLPQVSALAHRRCGLLAMVLPINRSKLFLKLTNPPRCRFMQSIVAVGSNLLR
jgi:DNA-binding transcriptional LysR family regulator